MGDRERNKKRLLELLQAAGTGNAHCADCGAAGKGAAARAVRNVGRAPGPPAPSPPFRPGPVQDSRWIRAWPLYHLRARASGSPLLGRYRFHSNPGRLFSPLWTSTLDPGPGTPTLWTPSVPDSDFPTRSSPARRLDPDWASYKLGIFICLNCSGVHRNFPDISKVKSVRLDFWDDSIVEFMTHNGNLRVKAKYEARVPAFYYIPKASDCIEGLLKYYTKEEGKGPKAVISIKDLNATFQTEKIGNPHGLQITYRREGHVRNLFVYHESGKEIVDWFNALRAVRLQYLKMAFPELPEPELVPLITRNYLKQGFMEKTGPKQREPFKKRWFALDPQERRLLYYKNPLDAFEQGQVFLGSDEQGYQVYEDLPKGIRGNRWKAGITIVTPQRRFIFTCPSEKEQREWMESFRDVLSRPLTPLNLLTASTESGYSSR
ncbi:hypothetical protein J1605_008946 [Eschrichtius robustus]|uniref:Arf-GAP with dual PH domain-containing protein 2 n=1 Tax=Eschrichtius robustus TaxID=9764 RepID=A0AB34GUX7_ESCRO|nr:hypothetical protein J1605_008946 [Eschrichtius robustus]